MQLLKQQLISIQQANSMLQVKLDESIKMHHHIQGDHQQSVQHNKKYVVQLQQTIQQLRDDLTFWQDQATNYAKALDPSTLKKFKSSYNATNDDDDDDDTNHFLPLSTACKSLESDWCESDSSLFFPNTTTTASPNTAIKHRHHKKNKNSSWSSLKSSHICTPVLRGESIGIK